MSELALGQKIQLSDGRTGFIRFIGQTGFAVGDWVGIELDDGSGKNDGSVQGERYFECPMGSGMFVRPATVTILAQPPPKPAAIKRSSRPSSMLTSGPGSRAGPADTGLAKRMSLNAPSPSPGPKSRPSSLVRVSRLEE
jgi:dynactin 1